MQADPKEQKSILYKSIVTGIAGMVGGVASTAIWHPLDLLRTRLSVQGFWTTGRIGEKYAGLLDAIGKILRQEGFFGMYRGVSAAMLGSGLSWGVYLPVYHFLQPQLGGAALGNFSSGVLAGVFQVMATNPIWLVKTRMQLQQNTCAYTIVAPPRYTGVTDGLKKVLQKEGIVGLYRGVTPALVMTTHGGIQFTVIEECKKIIQRTYLNNQLTPTDIFLASAFGKVLATIVTHPMLVVRVRLQDEHNTKAFLPQSVVTYTGLFGSVKTIWIHEGVLGFYKGILPNLLKAVPLSATAITIADITSQLLKKN